MLTPPTGRLPPALFKLSYCAFARLMAEGGKEQGNIGWHCAGALSSWEVKRLAFVQFFSNLSATSATHTNMLLFFLTFVIYYCAQLFIDYDGNLTSY